MKTTLEKPKLGRTEKERQLALVHRNSRLASLFFYYYVFVLFLPFHRVYRKLGEGCW